MFIDFLIFILALISPNYCQNYFVRFKSYDVPCSLITDNTWIKCIINQSDPLKFFSKSLLFNINIEFILLSINNLTLPMNFFVDDNLSNYFSITNNSRLILFDSTQNSQLKQINILTDTFINLFSTRIYFIIYNCSHPILQIEQNSFRYFSTQQILITYNNRTRTVFLEDYFTNECLIDDQLIFKNENENNLIKSTIIKFSNRKKQLNLTKLVINGILFSIVIILTSILICLNSRYDEHVILKSVSPPYSVIQTEQTSSVISRSESSVSVLSYVL